MKTYVIGDLQGCHEQALSMLDRIRAHAAEVGVAEPAILFAGDLINRADNDGEWGQWFDMDPHRLAETPSLMTPGNHEYMKPEGAEAQQLAPQWRLQFNLPDNGPSEWLSETVYRVDYQGVRVINWPGSSVN